MTDHGPQSIGRALSELTGSKGGQRPDGVSMGKWLVCHTAPVLVVWRADWEGRLPQTAKMHLEKAIEVAAKEGCAVTEIEIAEHHYKLVRCQDGHKTAKTSSYICVKAMGSQDMLSRKVPTPGMWRVPCAEELCLHLHCMPIAADGQ